MEYLSIKQKDDFAAIVNPVDQSIFIDEVIRKKAQTGKLVDFKSLPKWLNSRVHSAVKAICHPDIDKRPD